MRKGALMKPHMQCPCLLTSLPACLPPPLQEPILLNPLACPPLCLPTCPAGSVLLELSQLGVYQLDTRGAHVLLTAAEAALRRAPTLQRALPVAVAQTDVVHSAACSCGNCLLFCLGWARTARQPLETAEAESLLGAFSSLATTACKLAAAGAGARQSNSGSLGTNGSLVGGLLDILCHCEELAELAVELCATPPERCGR
ncbi:hypothetical protein ABPG75_008338 [Micractinium tetrahymenae]